MSNMSYTYKLRLSALSLVWMFAIAFLCLTAQAATTTAAPCCEECESSFGECVSACNGNAACETACWDASIPCRTNCVSCSR